MNKLFIKTGIKLTAEEIDEIDKAKAREWKIQPMNKHQLLKSLFFLLKDEDSKILAQGQIIKISPIIFGGERFSIFGIGGIIANKKGEGNGKKLMSGIREYLRQKNKTGVGFCKNSVANFYRKCGFRIIPGAQKRFVFVKNGKKKVNKTEDNVFCYDSEDRFIKKILKDPNIEIVLPRTPDW